MAPVALNGSAQNGSTARYTPKYPFDETVKTHPLLVVDYEKIAAGDESEIDTLWKAATTLGFFYLKNHHVDPEQMFEQVGAKTFELPLEEKMKFEQGDSGMSFGYKAAGLTLTDENGNPDQVEFINIAKDDALAYPEVVHRSYPAPTEAAMKPDGPARAFINQADEVTRALIAALTVRLGLPERAILDRHVGHSPSEARTIKKPPPVEDAAAAAKSAAIGSHTDFGTFSFLFNRMIGGLQVLVPGSQTADEWQYIRPIEGSAVCNLGDSLAIYSGGVLKSNMHRVVTPPGDQGKITRWSQVYFIRPAFDAILEPLTESPMIAESVKNWGFQIEPNTTSRQWFERRVKNQRAANFKGAETWQASRGTEHQARVA